MSQEKDAVSEGETTIEGGDDGIRGENDLTKGPWMPKEDAILTMYVERHGERYWNHVRKRYGLMRDGKSCRRRWLNHLRSSLKREEFTDEEEYNILRLHSMYGNRWSLLALHFPGRTDNEIKNYWNARYKKLKRAGLPIYPLEIIHEMRLRGKQQESPLSSPNEIDYEFGSIPSSSSSELKETFNDNSTPSSFLSSLRTNISYLSSFYNENPDFVSIDPMKFPLLVASLYDPFKTFELNLHGDNIGNTNVPPPPPSIIIPSLNLPYIPLSYQTPIAPMNMNPLLEVDDVVLSENFELETPSIQSSLQMIAPMNDDIVMPSNSEDNYPMDLEFCSERNNGMLEDVLRQSKALFNLELPSMKDKRQNDDQSQQRIMHDDETISLMPNLNSNVNLEPAFAPSFDDRTMEMVPGFSATDMEVNPQAHVIENFNMMDKDLWSWQQPTGPFQGTNGATNEPSSIVSSETMVATTNNLHVATTQDEIDHEWATEVMLSPTTTILVDTYHDWAQEVMGSPIAITPFDIDSSETMVATTNNLHVATTQDETDHEWAAEVMLSPSTTILADTYHDWAQEVMGSPIAITPFDIVSSELMVATTKNLHVSTTQDETDHVWAIEVMLSPSTTILADTYHDWAQEVMGSQIAIAPFDQDNDWTVGYLPNFS